MLVHLVELLQRRLDGIDRQTFWVCTRIGHFGATFAAVDLGLLCRSAVIGSRLGCQSCDNSMTRLGSGVLLEKGWCADMSEVVDVLQAFPSARLAADLRSSFRNFESGDRATEKPHSSPYGFSQQRNK